MKLLQVEHESAERAKEEAAGALWTPLNDHADKDFDASVAGLLSQVRLAAPTTASEEAYADEDEDHGEELAAEVRSELDRLRAEEAVEGAKYSPGPR